MPAQNEGYIKTRQGLSCIINERMVHGGMFEGEFQPIVSTQAAVYPVSLITGVYDFGTRKIKTIEKIETDFNGGYELAILFRNDIDSSFTTSAYVEPNKEGVVWLGASGVEFKFHLRTDGDDVNGSYIRVWLTVEDGTEWRLSALSNASR